MAQTPTEHAYFVRTDALCVNAKIGGLLSEYLFDRLDPRLKETFEDHLDECTACFVAVTNWKNLGPGKGD
jgi:hypothetical protein